MVHVASEPAEGDAPSTCRSLHGPKGVLELAIEVCRGRVSVGIPHLENVDARADPATPPGRKRGASPRPGALIRPKARERDASGR